MELRAPNRSNSDPFHGQLACQVLRHSRCHYGFYWEKTTGVVRNHTVTVEICFNKFVDTEIIRARLRSS